MRWFEHTLSDQFFEVKPAGRSNKCRFKDWILDDSPFEESPIKGGMKQAQKKLEQLNFSNYSKSRNHLSGSVSQLSAYIEHGLIEPGEILKFIDTTSDREEAYRFLQQLSWRDFFAKRYQEDPKTVWQDLQPYKTGFAADDYADELPTDIAEAKTDVAVINQFIEELQQHGYIHNHARLYLASYIVHWRRIKWQVGARWMLKYLLDGNIASNNYSWQWVASTGSHKPYLFNLDNVRNYAPEEQYNLSREANLTIAADYGELSQRLFPKMSNGG